MDKCGISDKSNLGTQKKSHSLIRVGLFFVFYQKIFRFPNQWLMHRVRLRMLRRVR